jgi:hypothetical protein
MDKENNLFSTLITDSPDEELTLTPANLCAIHAIRTSDPHDCDDITDDKLSLLMHALQLKQSPTPNAPLATSLAKNSTNWTPGLNGKLLNKHS